MRLIWSTDHIDLLRKFSAFLSEKGIVYSIDESVERNWGSEDFGNKSFRLWIQEENDVDKVKKYLDAFLENPQSPEFSLTPTGETQEEAPSHVRIVFSPTKRFIEQKLGNQLKQERGEIERPKLRFTNLLIALCCSLLLLEMWTSKDEKNIPLNVQKELVTTSPVSKALLFDYPEKYELIDKIASLYGYPALAKPQDLPAPGKFLYEKYLKTESYEGIYTYLIDWAIKLRGKKPEKEAQENAELFEKIRDGEFWRLVSPIFLHADILHLFFNMIWLLILGLQIEARLTSFKYLLFIVIVAIISNICQYLTSGPFFIGFSGVICGMAFFIRKRQKVAPWEGYQMNSATFVFIVFFIGTLAVLSALSFALAIFQIPSFLIGIANTAHITGAISGYCLGKLKFFSWQPKG